MDSRKQLTRILLAALAGLALASPLQAADQTTAGTATATAPSSTWLAFEVPFTGDDDRDGWTVVELGLGPGGPFTVTTPRKIPGPPEWRADTFRGLTPDTDYYLQVTHVDPDGVSGANPQVVGPIRTPAVAPNFVTLGTATATVGDTEIAVSLPIRDDANFNSYGTVAIATAPGGPWTERCGYAAAARLPFHPKRCRLRSLTPGTDYWVRVDVIDPDGVAGTDPQVLGPITYTGPANLAAGRPITADPGWGCCPNPAQLVDGRIQYQNWYYGFAWRGGLGGYLAPAGWKQATIDLGAPTTFDRVEVWLHDANSPPTDWRVETSNDGASWSVAWSTTEPQCRGASDQLEVGWGYPACSQGALFPPATARYVRYWFDDRTLFGGLHGWAVELEVFEPAPDPVATTAGTATATAPSSTWLAFEVPFSGDDDRDGWTVVELGLAPGGPFTVTTPRKIPGPPAWRADSFRGLTPDTDYYLQVTFVDPDGVSGANPQVVGPIRTLAAAANAVTLGTATATVGDAEIAVSLPIRDDANFNSYGTVAIATAPGGPWTERCGYAAAARLPFHPKRCRLRSLTPGTDYWVRVDVIDPDGVAGTDPQVLGPITYTGPRNLALGRPITADPGWGCCPNPAQLVDGRIQYQNWYYGFAWRGGLGGYLAPAGWKQATVDLGAPTTFDRVEVWLHDANSPPTTWRVETSNDGASWSVAWSTTEPQCRGASDQLEVGWGYPACSQGALFPPATARYVRYWFDDRTLFGGLHGWAVELEVFAPFAPVECIDNDGDGYGSPGDASCPHGAAEDCDDDDVDTYPGAAELCDGLDNDCDGTVPASEADGDGDTFRGCDGDCDDDDHAVFPGAPETLCDGIDQNCNGPADDDPNPDGDPVSFCDVPTDCDNNDPRNYPGNLELCDGADNNCDAAVDEGFDLDGNGVADCGDLHIFQDAGATDALGNPYVLLEAEGWSIPLVPSVAGAACRWEGLDDSLNGASGPAPGTNALWPPIGTDRYGCNRNGGAKALYKIVFTTPGTYTLYLRNRSGLHWRWEVWSSHFLGQFARSKARGNPLGGYAWTKTLRTFTVTAAQVGKPRLLVLSPRDEAFILDQMLLSASPALTDFSGLAASPTTVVNPLGGAGYTGFEETVAGSDAFAPGTGHGEIGFATTAGPGQAKVLGGTELGPVAAPGQRGLLPTTGRQFLALWGGGGPVTVAFDPVAVGGLTQPRLSMSLLIPAGSYGFTSADPGLTVQVVTDAGTLSLPLGGELLRQARGNLLDLTLPVPAGATAATLSLSLAVAPANAETKQVWVDNVVFREP